MKKLNAKVKLVNKQTGLNGLLQLKNEFSEICLIEEVSYFDSKFFREVYNNKLGLFY